LFKENVAGRLQRIKISGVGAGMRVELWNWTTLSWNNMGVYNLGMAAAGIPVGINHAPNGATYMRLSQVAPGSTKVTKLRTDVF
jgi:hypothetical protein